MNTRLILSLAVVALLGATAPVVSAQPTELKQQMAQRLPAIDDLRRRLVVGENNAGFLEVRGKATPEETQLVEAENRDRAAVYEAIAKRSETTADTVGKARAKQIANASARGLLIQDADGRWAEKR
ncbi:MAG TPA: DUF1318 domain-containing protein [Opitutaceae bacterium]|nr:DUF1318 domain-containing protein [Opitutaceae bacterium]